jgi:UPF0716 family protein affecting phage T7 exclusion
VVATLGLLLFIGLVVAAVFFGRNVAGQSMLPWHTERRVAEAIRREGESHEGDHHTPGTLVLAGVFLLSFAVYYFANWKWLSDVWHVR